MSLGYAAPGPQLEGYEPQGPKIEAERIQRAKARAAANAADWAALTEKVRKSTDKHCPVLAGEVWPPDGPTGITVPRQPSNWLPGAVTRPVTEGELKANAFALWAQGERPNVDWDDAEVYLGTGNHCRLTRSQRTAMKELIAEFNSMEAEEDEGDEGATDTVNFFGTDYPVVRIEEGRRIALVNGIEMSFE